MELGPHIRPVPVAYPPDLLRAIGYVGEARYVSICYDATEARYADGRISADGCFWPYQAFTDFPPVALFCEAEGTLGGDDMPPTHALLIDTQEQLVYVGPRSAVRVIVRQQWPPLPEEVQARVAELSPEELETVVQQALAASRLTPDQAAAREAERLEAEKRLMAWLQDQPDHGLPSLNGR